jgi:hypothetical protein
MGWDPWNAVAGGLVEVELRNLARGLVVAELELNWQGGSVAGVIWVYQRFASRFPDRAKELADWLLAKSKNPYAPYGSRRGGARSDVEFRAYQAKKARRFEESQREEEEARQQKRIRSAIRKRLAQERQVLKAAHNLSRMEIIRQLQELPPKERLEHLAWDDSHLLSFFPDTFAYEDKETFEQLDAGTRKRLLDKMAARRTGAWKRLYARLVAI